MPRNVALCSLATTTRGIVTSGREMFERGRCQLVRAIPQGRNIETPQCGGGRDGLAPVQSSHRYAGTLCGTSRTKQRGIDSGIVSPRLRSNLWRRTVRLRTEVNGIKVQIDLPGVTTTGYTRTRNILENGLAQPKTKNRETIRDAYLYVLNRSRNANPSDLWHHVVYRVYCEIFKKHRPQDPKQSWVRASGDALELTLESLYAPVFAPHNIRILPLISRERKRTALDEMGLSTAVGSDKLDIALYRKESGAPWRIFGGVHVKASLAERVSDDVPCSRAMMAKGHWSPLWTLDVKSFPPPHGNLVNKGEFGSPTEPSEKRKYIEQHGEFDNCYSANCRTIPSVPTTPSGKRIYTLELSRQPDQFARDTIARALKS